jgi:hypothetical protein
MMSDYQKIVIQAGIFQKRMSYLYMRATQLDEATYMWVTQLAGWATQLG